MTEERWDRLEATVAELVTGQTALRSDVDQLKTDVADLRGHMLVLHEEVIDTIKALAPDFEPLRREMHQGDAEVRREMNDRVVPIEEYIRQQQSQHP